MCSEIQVKRKNTRTGKKKRKKRKKYVVSKKDNNGKGREKESGKAEKSKN